MIVECPGCQARLRHRRHQNEIIILQIVCPVCGKKFQVQGRSPALTAVIAHDDESVCQLLLERVAKLGGKVRICRDVEQVMAAYTPLSHSVLLLDVAFAGTFQFQLIDKLKATDSKTKIVLLPSVYNRTAYKKKPDSLYGADDYLELHHIGDRLLPMLGRMFPEYSRRANTIAPIYVDGEERPLVSTEVDVKARHLAGLLVADMLLYHRKKLEDGLNTGQLKTCFAELLDEGRRMLIARLPESAALESDYIQQAFDEACQSYQRT